MTRTSNRRTFLKQAGAAAITAPMFVRNLASAPPSSRVRHASIGVGGMGGSDLGSISSHASVDIVCLAGFMRLLTPGFVAQWPECMLNIHPALLPAFKGLGTHKRAIAANAKIHGATVHFVSAELDSGPIIAQGAVAVRGGETEETLAARVLKVEHRIYPAALRLVAEGRVGVTDGRCLIDGIPTPDSSALNPDPA